MALANILVRTVDCKQGAVRAIRFNANGEYCMSCGSDKTIKLWNPYTGTMLKSYTGHGYEVMDAQSSCDNSQIVSCGLDKTVILWDVSTGQAIRRYRGHAGPVNSVRFNEESSIAISGSVDGTIKTWDCRSKKLDPVQSLGEAKDSVTSIQVSDHEILSGSADGKVRRYDLRQGQLTTDTIGSPVSFVSFTRDGQCILASCMNSTLKLMDKDNGQMLAEFTGHKNTKYKIDNCLSNTDAKVFSGSEDASVYCWDLLEGSITCKLEHKWHRVIHSLSHHPTTPCLLTAGEGKFFVWKDKMDETATSDEDMDIPTSAIKVETK